MDNINHCKLSLFSSPIQKILLYLVENPDKTFSDAELGQVGLGIKRSAINMALRQLASLGWIQRDKIGRTAVNRLMATLPIIATLKVLAVQAELYPYLEKCKSASYKIVLFGSRGDGTYSSDSDWDLFIVSDQPDSISKVLSSFPYPLNLIIKGPDEVMRLHESEPVLANSVSKGMVLWEKE